MIESIKEAFELAIGEFYKEFGEDAKMEDGDQIVTVFNNGTMIIGYINGEIDIQIIYGEPYRVNHSLQLVDKGEEE